MTTENQTTEGTGPNNDDGRVVITMGKDSWLFAFSEWAKQQGVATVLLLLLIYIAWDGAYHFIPKIVTDVNDRYAAYQKVQSEDMKSMREDFNLYKKELRLEYEQRLSEYQKQTDKYLDILQRTRSILKKEESIGAIMSEIELDTALGGAN